MEWYHILGIVFCASVIDNLFGLLIYVDLYEKWYTVIPLPSDFKDETDMNWFGCIICYLLLFILFPILNICKFIYWLFHINSVEVE